MLYENVMVDTKHAAVQWLLTISGLSGWLMRCSFRRAEFYFKVKCKKGQKNLQADAISRLLTDTDTIREDEENEVLTLDAISVGHQPE